MHKFSTFLFCLVVLSQAGGPLLWGPPIAQAPTLGKSKAQSLDDRKSKAVELLMVVELNGSALVSKEITIDLGTTSEQINLFLDESSTLETLESKTVLYLSKTSIYDRAIITFGGTNGETVYGTIRTYQNGKNIFYRIQPTNDRRGQYEILKNNVADFGDY